MPLKIAFAASRAPVAQTARAVLVTSYGDVAPQEADVIVARMGTHWSAQLSRGDRVPSAPFPC